MTQTGGRITGLWIEWATGCVCHAYQTGLTQSFIVHTALLLILAGITTHTPKQTPPLLIAIDFSSTQDSDVDMRPIVDVVPAIDFQPHESTESFSAATFSSPYPLLQDALSTDTRPIDAIEINRPTDSLTPATVDLLTEVPTLQPPSVAVAAAQGRDVGPHASQKAGQRAGGAGIDGELGRRLQVAGAKSGDVQISIRWENVNDIDLHVKVEPIGRGAMSGINWTNRIGSCGGMLDVDANANSGLLTPQPVENVFWAKGRAPYGRYTVYIHHYRNWAGPIDTPVELAVLVDGEVQRLYPHVTFGNSPVMVTSFVRSVPPAIR